MGPTTLKHPPRTLMEVFKGLPEGTLAQLIVNNIIMSPSPLYEHQKVLDKLYRQLGNFIENNNLGETLVAPFDVYLDRKNVYQPDIIFISKDRLHCIKEDGMYDAPDLVIEILSPSTAKYDLEEKKDVYERCGVKEYWIVDPATRSTWGYSLKGGSFGEVEKSTGVIHSRLLGTELHF